MEDYPLIVTELELKQAALLNVVADSQHVETTPLRKCEISTTVNDIKYGTLTLKGEAHEACVIFFCFEIVGQHKTHAQRVQQLDITLAVFRAATTVADQKQTVHANGTGTAVSTSLEIRHREPTYGKTISSKQSITSQANIGGQVGFQYAGANVGYSMSKQQDVQDFAYLESNLRNTRAVNYKLRENAMLQDGVPRRLECALILRTDRIPFSIGVTFTAVIPYVGKIWRKTAEAKVVVGESFLRRGNDASALSECPSLQEMESDAFLEWVQSKLHNDWVTT